VFYVKCVTADKHYFYLCFISVLFQLCGHLKLQYEVKRTTQRTTKFLLSHRAYVRQNYRSTLTSRSDDLPLSSRSTWFSTSG